jgi:hypothetical protein
VAGLVDVEMEPSSDWPYVTGMSLGRLLTFVSST